MEYSEPVFDIIICVKDALTEVRLCIESIERYTPRNYYLILINDNSAEETRTYLESILDMNTNCTLLHNEATMGYTQSLNLGLKAVKSDYVIILNSDTIVTSNWSNKLIGVLKKNNNIVLCSALSNAASWQSIPEIFDEEGNYRVNLLPPEEDLDSFSLKVQNLFKGQVTNVSFINGFCMCVKSLLFIEIGFFDAINFPIGYGEEIDFCLRAKDKGYDIAVALDTYIYHHKSKSFGIEKRKELAKKGRSTLNNLYGQEKIALLYKIMKEHKEIGCVRTNIAENYY